MNGFLSKMLLISLLIVCGCSSSRKHEWRKAGVTPEQVAKDCQECSKKMQIDDNVASFDDFRRSQNIGQHGSVEIGVRFSDSPEDSSIISCMKARGYRRVLVDF